ncbi:Uncharacterised protein [Escherichia coli]|nr:Uncharacterised protein [Escherichia coli]
MVLVIGERVGRLVQIVDGALRLVPNMGRRGHRVLQLVFVLLELGLVFLNLLGRLRDRFQSRHDVLRQIGAINYWNTGVNGLQGAGRHSDSQSNFSG